MIIGIGTDIIEIDRIKKAISRNSNFIDRLFTENEKKYFASKNNLPNIIAGNFAAKEAVSKAVGTGFRNFGFKDIEVTRDLLGKPVVYLTNKVYEVIGRRDVIIHISISHSNDNAISYAVMEG